MNIVVVVSKICCMNVVWIVVMFKLLVGILLAKMTFFFI
jgi:hypothetical protein